jgi:hypothetical protein
VKSDVVGKPVSATAWPSLVETWLHTIGVLAGQV